MSKFWQSKDYPSENDCEREEESIEEDEKVSSISDVSNDHGANVEHIEDDGDAIDISSINDEDDPNEIWKKIRHKQLFSPVPTIKWPVAASNNNTNSQQQLIQREDYTRLVIISDTHGQHRQIHLPKGDILIHGGDLTKSGEIGTIEDLCSYFQESWFREIVCIAGNHDITLDTEYYQRNWKQYHDIPFDYDHAQQIIKDNCIYLQDSQYITNNGLLVYGSPFSPEFFHWAFNADRGKPIQHIWDKIPDRLELGDDESKNLDILLVHGPPLGRGDKTHRSGHAGCYNLLKTIQERIKPRICIFGHIHEQYGCSYDGTTLFINASSVNYHNERVNDPIVIDITNRDKTQPPRVVQPLNCKIKTRQELGQFCTNNGYNVIAQAVESSGSDNVPTGDALLNRDVYWTLIDALKLHRSKSACAELHHVLAQIYAESFD